MKLSRNLRRRVAWAKSFLKRQWTFEDYPLDYVDQSKLWSNPSEHSQNDRWRADLLGLHLCGLGETKEIALENLKRKFAAFETNSAIHRPGTVREIEFAPNERVSRFPELKDHFIKEVLGLEWAWLSDESSLLDFQTGPDQSVPVLKIGEVYGVDVSHISNGNIAEILEFIMEEIRDFPEDKIQMCIRTGRDERMRRIMGLPMLPWQDDPYLGD